MAIHRSSIDMDINEVKASSKNSLNLYIYNSLHAKELLEIMFKNLKIKDKSILLNSKITINIDDMIVNICIFDYQFSDKITYAAKSRNFMLFPCSVRDDIESINTTIQYLCYHEQNKKFVFIVDLIDNLDGMLNKISNSLTSTFRLGSKNKALERNDSGITGQDITSPRSRTTSQSENGVMMKLKNICQSNAIREPSRIQNENYMHNTIKAFFKYYEKYVDDAVAPIVKRYENQVSELKKTENDIISSIDELQKRLVSIQKEKESKELFARDIVTYATGRKELFQGFRDSITNKSTLRTSIDLTGSSPPSKSSYNSPLLLKSSDSFRDRGSVRFEEDDLGIATSTS